MASAAVMEFTEQNFDAEVIKSSQPVLVDFWAEWCGPCKMLAPIIDQVAEEFKGRAKIGKVDTDANRNVTMQYKVSAIPTVFIFKEGQIVKKFVGMTNKQHLADAINAALS